MRLILGPVLTCLVWQPATAQQGNALSFDGMDDRVMVPYDSSFPTEIFTVSAWIKTPAPGQRAAIIARGEDDDSFNLSWHLYVISSGTLEIMLEDQNEQNDCYPSTCMGQPRQSCVVDDLFVADDSWHHVAATRDGSGTLVLYVDGQPRATCQQTSTPSSNNFQFLTIGCTHGQIGPPPPGQGEPPTWFFPGQIDEPAMWNVALTDAQIQDVYAIGVSQGSAGLVGYWPLDECSGQLVADLSPAGNDGFLGADSNEAGDSADPQRVTITTSAADLDGDGMVGITDLFIMFGEWGACPQPCPPGCPADLDEDCTVGITDLFELFSRWGGCL